MPSSPNGRPINSNALLALLSCAFLLVLAGCPASGERGQRAETTEELGIRFPTAAAVSVALRDDLGRDPGFAQADALVKLLGGEKAQLTFAVKRVVARQPYVFEAHYDVTLALAQSGQASLARVYAQLIPKGERDKLGGDDAAEYLAWLNDHAKAQESKDPSGAAKLRAALDDLAACYADKKSGESVTLMTGLAATVLPSSDGWYAEKLPSASLTLRCLPL